MFIHNIDPVLFNLGPLEIRYYGLFYVVGFLFTLWWFSKFADRIKKEQVYDLILYLIIGVILGARAFIVLYYEPSYYFTHPAEIFAFWHGGMSFHGGLVGAMIAGYLFSRKYKVNFFYLADLGVMPAAVALTLGRVGNFINGELWGRLTTVSWCFKFPRAEGCRHPSQFYQSAQNLVLFFILYFTYIQNKVKQWRLPDGFIFWLFITLYGAARFVIEFFRESPVYYYGISKGQILCLVMIVVGVIMLWIWQKILKKT